MPPACALPRQWAGKLDQAAAGTGRQGPHLRARGHEQPGRRQGRRRKPGRWRHVQHRPELLFGGAHLCARIHPRCLRRGTLLPPSPRSSKATRWTRPPTSVPSPAHRSWTCWTRRWPMPRPRRHAAALRRAPSAAALATGTSPRCSRKVDHSMELMREESFGPVIGIQKVSSDDEEAVKLMNDTRYGLTAGCVHPRRSRGA